MRWVEIAHKAGFDWNEADFYKNLGYYPEHDDLDRTNCKLAGEYRHIACGICIAHGVPLHECVECYSKISI